MNSKKLKNLIETAREIKGISQRELAKLTGISRSTLNDIINGKIKKIDIDDLRKIAETLDISLQELLKVTGYNAMLLYFSNDKSTNEYDNDLKAIVKHYNLLFDYFSHLVNEQKQIEEELNKISKILFNDCFFFQIINSDGLCLTSYSSETVMPVESPEVIKKILSFNTKEELEKFIKDNAI